MKFPAKIVRCGPHGRLAWALDLMESLQPPRERQLAPDEAQEISMFARDGRKTVNLGFLTNDPAKIVAAIDTYIDATQQAELVGSLTLNDDNCTFLSLQLGCLWGEQLVKMFGWEWVCLTDNGSEQFAVASKDRALIVLPTYFARDCLKQPDMDCTAMLAYNMLAARKFSEAPVGGYLNVLDNVVRIVPRH
jgi:hypothetical protein